MHIPKKIVTRTLVLAASLIVGCNAHTDREPDVVLEVTTITIPPVATTLAAGVCTFTVTTSSGTFADQPKNALAIASPFMDIILQQVTVDYFWDDGAVLANQVFGIGGTVPANGTNTAQFLTASDAVLASGVSSRAGHSANLRMVFSGHTVNGESIYSQPVGGGLLVNTCLPTGACCSVNAGGGAICTDGVNQASCAGGGYKGDGTSCALVTCP
jgi:hypothetical protein